MNLEQGKTYNELLVGRNPVRKEDEDRLLFLFVKEMCTYDESDAPRDEDPFIYLWQYVKTATIMLEVNWNLLASIKYIDN